MKKILSFGEILWDIVQRKEFLGGAPLNFAAHAYKCGAKTGIISAVGTDSLGKRAIQSIKELNVNTNLVQQLSDRTTGTVHIELDHGQPTYSITENVAYDYILSQADSDYSQYDYFYFGTLCQRNEVSQKSLNTILDQGKFDHVFYDINLRSTYFSREIITASLQKSTIVKMNDEEVELLNPLLFASSDSLKSFSKKLIEQYPNIEILIITLGKKGCIIFNRKDFFEVPSQSIIVQDTIGAGDAFSAAFFITYLTTKDCLKSAEIANKIGGFVASQKGAIPEYSQEILSLLS